MTTKIAERVGASLIEGIPETGAQMSVALDSGKASITVRLTPADIGERVQFAGLVLSRLGGSVTTDGKTYIGMFRGLSVSVCLEPDAAAAKVA